MAVLTYSEIQELVEDHVVSNTATDAPIDSAALLRTINDAYSRVWQISGGAITLAKSSTLWSSAENALGVVTGILANIEEILHLWASTEADPTTPGNSTGDRELVRKELSEVLWHQRSSLTGSYDRPHVYAVVRMETAAPGDVGKLRLYYAPRITGYYFPAMYRPFFTPMDGDASDKPSVNDLESYDIAYLAALDFCQRLGRPDLAPGIAMKVSDATSRALARKGMTLLSADQDKETIPT